MHEIQSDAFFDELTKISASLSGKGALVGGAIGTGIGTLKAVSRESRERSADDRAMLPEEMKKKLRKKRLVGHAASVAGWGGVGAGVGSAHKKVGDIAGKFTKSVREGVQPEVNKFVDETGKRVSDAANKAAEDFKPSKIFWPFKRKKKG